jgi:hypothetical protein
LLDIVIGAFIQTVQDNDGSKLMSPRMCEELGKKALELKRHRAAQK